MTTDDRLRDEACPMCGRRPNAHLREMAAAGVRVTAHPDVLRAPSAARLYDALWLLKRSRFGDDDEFPTLPEVRVALEAAAPAEPATPATVAHPDVLRAALALADEIGRLRGTAIWLDAAFVGVREARLDLRAALEDPAAPPPLAPGCLEPFHDVQYDAGCDKHGGITHAHCAICGHWMPERAPAEPPPPLPEEGCECGACRYLRRKQAETYDARLAAEPATPEPKP